MFQQVFLSLYGVECAEVESQFVVEPEQLLYAIHHVLAQLGRLKALQRHLWAEK